MSAVSATAGLGHPTSQRSGQRWHFTLAAAILLAVLVSIDVVLGPAGARVSLADFSRVLATRLLHMRFAASDQLADADSIVWLIRLPRAVGAAIVGALLAYAGVALQGLLLNPLAEPYTVGVSAGAALGALGAELLGIGELWLGFGRVAAAFGAGAGAVILVYWLARVRGRVSVSTFLLAGVIVGTMLSAFIPLLFTLAHQADRTDRLLFYLVGSLSGVDWPRAGLLAPFLVITFVVLRLSSRDMNAMTLGEETAAHLGVETESVKRRVLAVGSLATAAAVSVAGIIGFVGLVVPHLARRLVGPDHRALLPLAALLGASLLVAADTVVRVLLNEMQVGVVTALVGAPVFCYMLRRRVVGAW